MPEIPSKVMHICLSQSWGGLEMYPGRVAAELERQGWAVHGLALKGSRVAKSLDASSTGILTFNSVGDALLRVFQIRKYLWKNDIHVVHAHKSGDMRLAALLVSLWPEIRLFFTDHMGVKRPKKDLYHRWAYSKLHRLFSISQATHKRNLSAFPLRPEKVTHLYYGIDLSAYSEPLEPVRRVAIRESLGVVSDSVAIALPGRISQAKGHSVWVDALSRLKRDYAKKNWTGLVIGEPGGAEAKSGGFADQLKDRIEDLGLARKIIFTGFRKDLAECLKAVDIVCVPSTDEAFGLSVIEAMAAGRPVIGSAAGAIPELIGRDRGITVPPNKPDLWAGALSELVSAPALRAGLGAEASGWVHGRFALADHVEALTSFYKGSDR